MTTPPDPSSSVDLAHDEVSFDARPAAHPVLAAPQPTLQQTHRYRLVARADPAPPSEWARRAHAAQVATALDITETLAATVMAGDLSALDQLLAPTFCWWSVPRRRSGDDAPTGAFLPLEPLATRSTFLALARRWRHAFDDLVITVGPSLVDTEDRLFGPTDPPTDPLADAQARAGALPDAPPTPDAASAAPFGGSPAAALPLAQPSPAVRPAPFAGAFGDRFSDQVGSRMNVLVTVCWSATARHMGPLGRFPATDAVVRLAGVAHLRYDATGQVTHVAVTCVTPFWAQLPGLESLAIGPVTVPTASRA